MGADAKLPAMPVSPRVLLGWRTAEPVGFAPGDYLTDGERLLRVVSRFDPAAEHRFRKRAPASEGDALGIMSLGCVMQNMWLMAESWASACRS